MRPEDLVLGGMAAIVLATAALGLGALSAWRRAAERAAAGGAPAGTGIKLAFAVSLTLFLLATLLLGLESYLRFAYDATDSFALTKTTQRWFDRHYRHNSWNVRDDAEYAAAKRAARRRISFVGDSFTAGHGVADVEERFANLLRAAHPEWEVHVLARNGLDTRTQLGMVEASLEAGYETDEIVLVYCLNDIVELVPEWRETVEEIYGGVADGGFLVRHSYAVNQLYFRLWKAPDPDVADYFGIVAGAYEGPVWKEQEALLRSFVALARERGIRFRVVTFPFLHALGPDYPYAPIHARLGGLWAELGVPHLDLLEVYAGRAPEDLVVNRFDAHPNEVAHALAAAAIDDFLGGSAGGRGDEQPGARDGEAGQETFLDQIGAYRFLETYESCPFCPHPAEDFSSARDADEHGTHTASTAAGNRGVRTELLDLGYGGVSGVAPRAHVSSHTGVTAVISRARQRAARADVVAAFSSRGGPANTLGIAKPDLAAPGVQILAGDTPERWNPAAVDGELFQALGGTSMASPHVAGAAALLRHLHPGWTPGRSSPRS